MEVSSLRYLNGDVLMNLKEIVREWSLFMAGGAVEFRKSLALKTCPPSIVAHYVCFTKVFIESHK